MSHSSARRRACAALAATLLLAGCAGGGDPSEPADAAPTTLAELADEPPQVGRIAFCDLVPEDAVATALGDAPEDLAEQEPGDRQEVGCTWTAGEVTARAWVFARPVDDALAAQVVREAGTRRGCTAEPVAGYGDPGVVQVCERAGSTRVRHAGRFGDTWLGCELEGPAAAEIGPRAEAWCVAVASSVDTDA